MDTLEQAEIRAALVRKVDELGYRSVARQIGMSPTGLQKFLNGTPGQPRTWTKLRSWYVREIGGETGDTPEGAAVALGSLVRYVEPGLRKRAEQAITALLASMYGHRGLPAPGWLIGLEGARAAYDEGVQSRGECFATVEPLRGDPFVVPRPPFEGEPRAVVERMGTERGVWDGDAYLPPHRIGRIRLGE